MKESIWLVNITLGLCNGTNEIGSWFIHGDRGLMVIKWKPLTHDREGATENQPWATNDVFRQILLYTIWGATFKDVQDRQRCSNLQIKCL